MPGELIELPSFSDGQSKDKDHLIRAVAYVRMSRARQIYSAENQTNAIKAYADLHGISVLRVYADLGKSGLDIKGREAAKRLIDVIDSGNADFEAILVYDVSRWGRFQDADEAAYYEHICRRAGIQIHYCAEQFLNDGTAFSSIVKAIKRVMAAEYSRELSVKVFQGQWNVAAKGFKIGGMAGYGMRRMLVDKNGKHKGILALGEHKNLVTDRVILVPGPKEEREVVQEIFRLFVEEDWSPREITDHLNRCSIPAEQGAKWTKNKVRCLLGNEKCIGTSVFNRTSKKLKTKTRMNPQEEWLRIPNAFEPIISEELFWKARKKIEARKTPRKSTPEIIEALQRTYEREGRLCHQILHDDPELPHPTTLVRRFGSLEAAYRLAGYDDFNQQRMANGRTSQRRRNELISIFSNIFEEHGHTAVWNRLKRAFRINDEYYFDFTLSNLRLTKAGNWYWTIPLRRGSLPDFRAAICMHRENETASRYYLFQPGGEVQKYRTIRKGNLPTVEQYRVGSLDELVTRVSETWEFSRNSSASRLP